MAKGSKESASFHLASELGGLELLDAKYTHQNFSRHSHEGYTIGVIEKGAQRFYRTGGNHIAPQDSIILVNADEIHNGQTATEGGWEYKAMYPLPEQFAQLTEGLSSGSSIPYFPEPVVYDPELAQQLRLVFDTLAQSDNKLLRETLIYGTLVKLVSRHSKSKLNWEPKTRSQRQLLLVKEFLDDFPQADVSLEDLSKLAGLSLIISRVVSKKSSAYRHTPIRFRRGLGLQNSSFVKDLRFQTLLRKLGFTIKAISIGISSVL